MSAITQNTFTQPEMSWRRKRSLATLTNSQNHKTNMKMAKASATKFLNVNPPSKSNVSSQFFFAASAESRLFGVVQSRRAQKTHH